MSEEEVDVHDGHGEETPVFTKEQHVEWYSKHLVQLQCDEVSWAGEKIPAHVVSYIVGDLASIIRAGVYLKKQRLLLDLDLEEVELSDLRARLCSYKNIMVKIGGYSCKFTFFDVGGYPDLVEIMANIMMDGHDGSVLETDVVHEFPKQEHPVFQYLMMEPPRHSTPAKKKPWAKEYEGILEMVGKMPAAALQQLVKDLADKQGIQVQLKTEAKGLPHMSSIPHEASFHESMVHATSVVVQEMIGKGIMKGSTPKLEQFSADPTKISFASWQSRVRSFEKNYTDAAIKEAIQNSLKGRPAQDVEALPPDADWRTILGILGTKYQNKASYDALLSEFYSLTMESDDDCASFSTKLEQQLQYVRHNYPEKLKAAAYWDLLKGRFFHGIPDNIRTNIRGLFNTPDMDYYQLLAAAREIEGEKIVPKKPTASTTTASQEKTDKSHKPKPKVSAVQVADPDVKKLERAWSQTSNDLQEMQKTLKDLTKAMGRLQQASTSATPASTSEVYRWSCRGWRYFN